jgi:amino acid transporter
MPGLFRTKTINADHHLLDTGLRRVLGPLDLTLLGIGAIIGAGIFVLTGVAAATKGGPAIVVSYAIAGRACAFSALAYAELAAAIGGCGSAYGYSYAGLGEIVAWVIGWDLILEYGVATAAVTIGWSGYMDNALVAMGLQLPDALLKAPADGGLMNLPAAAIVLTLAGLLTAVVPYPTLNVGSPVADVMLRLGYPWAAALVAAGAIAGLTTVMLVLYYGLTRVFLAMSRDGLLPPRFARVHPRTPVRVIVISGLIIAAVAGLTPIGDVAELVNIGTLAAFLLVCLGVVSLRYSHPGLPRPFRTPWSPLVPLLGAGACLYLMLSLPPLTWIRFGVWLVVGLVVYFAYSRSHSQLAAS